MLSEQAVEVARIARVAAMLLVEGLKKVHLSKQAGPPVHKREATMMTRPGIWIWMIVVMVLTGAGITGVLLLAPENADVRLHIAIAALVSGVASIPISRMISKTMMAPAS